MFYRKNVGRVERWLRGSAGILMVGVAILLEGARPGWLLMAGGVITLLTAFIGFCPACALFRRKPLEDSPP